VPLPVDCDHYVVVLQNRSGELSALRHASDTTWGRTTPLLAFVGPRDPARPISASAVDGWVKRVSAAVGTHAVYFDLLRLSPTTLVAGKAGVRPILEEIYYNARKRKVRFVPVFPVGESSEAHIELVRASILGDSCGAALRYRILKTLPPSGVSRNDILQRHLEGLGQEPANCDLLIDLEFIDEDQEIDAASLAAQLEAMSQLGRWRSVVLLGTSIPMMMSAVREGSVGTIPRRERELWLRLRKQGMDRVPAFGDYAVQHPHPPHDGGANTGRANIRYTADIETVVARGFGPASQGGPEQYRELCQQLVGRGEFAGRDYSWGDETIQDCAEEVIEPGSRNAWRGAGTSHHMQVVTDELGQLSMAA
jgi:Beta protein